MSRSKVSEYLYLLPKAVCPEMLRFLRWSKRKSDCALPRLIAPAARVVGSIRAVAMEERHHLADKIWDSIENGKEYDGVVKSLTSYGAFVDIGGVDGMVHISEAGLGPYPASVRGR